MPLGSVIVFTRHPASTFGVDSLIFSALFSDELAAGDAVDKWSNECRKCEKMERGLRYFT